MSLSLLVASFSYGIRAHQVRSYLIIPDPPKLLEECSEMKPDEIIETLNKNYSVAVTENSQLNEEKADFIKMANRLALSSLILFSLFVVLIIAS